MCLRHDYFPLDPHLVDAAIKFEDLGYLQTFNSVVEINHSHQPTLHPPHSTASEFVSNLMISVFTKLNQIINVFWGRRTPPL